ncbi:MAG: TonB-dependent receptor [Rickettsiales bacterium]|nr:TonB-dependent receptor [Rickettsiales bacterium]
MKNSLLTLLVCSSTLAAVPAVAADKKPSSQMPAVVVTATQEGSLTVPDNATANQEIQKTPGGVEVVDAKDYEDKYSLNFEDTLAYVPGVYAQKRFGEEVRISIRGSGLSRGFHLRGLDLLQDGIPFNLADGAADFQEADSLAMQRIEVFKGANALQYGSSTLGGAVNMVSKTGRSNPGDQVRAEIGSYDTYRFNAQSGRSFGDYDMFLSLTGTSGEGFREHSAQENIKFNSNFGQKISDKVETRFYVSGNIIKQELPGSVSKAAALHNPKAADPSAITADQHRDMNSLRVSNKTTFSLDNGDRIDAGAFISLKELFHPITPFVGVIDQASSDYGAFVQGSGEYSLADYRNRYKLGFTPHLGDVNAKVFQNINGSRGALTSKADQSSQNVTLYGENNFYVVPQWAMVTGAQATWSKRDENNQLSPAESANDTYAAINPKIGVLYEPRNDLQFFANVSKSFEPPTFSELTQSGTVGFTPVDPQKAWTAEIGSRGSYGIAAWDVSLYRAWIHDEMLQYTIGSGIPASTFNAGDTIHQGLELGLDLQVAQNVVSKGDHVQLRNAYTYSDYYFENDPQYGDNDIAGQPKHFLQIELRYDHADGWYVAPNIELASDADVDFSNTVTSPGYGLLGLGAGYEVNQNLDLFVDGRNLLDKRYISTFSTTVSGGGNVFYPGDGRTFYAGMRLKL